VSSSDYDQIGGQSGAVVGDRGLAAWEIASVASSILIAEWILSAVMGRSKLAVAIPIALAFVLMIGSHLLRGETLRDLGFRFDNFLRAGKLLLLPMLLTALLSLLAGWWFGWEINFLRWHAGRPIVGQLVLGFGWGLLQQYVLQGFINRRAQVIWGQGWHSFRRPSSAESLAHCLDPWRGDNLGDRLSKSTESFCVGRVAFPDDLGARIHVARFSAQSFAHWIQVLRLGLPRIIRELCRLSQFKGSKVCCCTC
jgi:hypothetical protein